MSDSPYINRFLSADTIVPGYANPQNLNRFSYTLNNPLRYTDPTGHMVCEDYGGTCLSEKQVTQNYETKLHKHKQKNKDTSDGGGVKPLTMPDPGDIPMSSADGSPACPSCVLEGVSIFVSLAPAEITLGIGIVLVAAEAPLFEPILVIPELLALDVTLVGVELIAQGQHRSAQDIRLDPFPIIPTSTHMFNPEIWK